MAEPSSSVMLKLLFDTKGHRVLFAEARKDFIDFLFQILTLRMGTLISLLREENSRVGSLPNLYESLESLKDSFRQPNDTMDTFLEPVSNLLNPATVKKNVYTCACKYHNPIYYSDDSRTVCPNCEKQMKSSLSYVDPNPKAAKRVGAVKDSVTYMVMDDLVVTPLSTISGITLLNKFNVKDVATLEEKVVHFGVHEAVKLLNASLQSTKVFTDVFFKGIQIKIEESQ